MLASTSCTVNIPKEYAEKNSDAKIYPDYSNITIPCNIASMNFAVEEDVDQYVVRISDSNGKDIMVKADGKKGIDIPLAKWKKMLADNIGGKIDIDIYGKKDGKWCHYNTITNVVSKDSIDEFLTYRLIEPSYMAGGEMGVYQFDLTKGEENAIFTNHMDHMDPSNREQKCLNCHTSQRNHPENKMFYYRSGKGGMMLTYNGKLTKIDTKTGDMVRGTVYPSWHPYLPLIAFSSNSIKQGFYSNKIDKIDPFDEFSDLVMYDIEKNEVTAVRKTYNKQETNPCWSGDGNYLYFNSTDSIYKDDPAMMLYNLYRIKFNASDKSWGEDELLYEAAKKGKSATYPKVSPDDKYILFTEADHGTSTQTNRTADLYLYDLTNKTCRELSEINSPTQSDSYHDWSSNSKWIVFCTRREDGNYARAYLSHIGEDGKFSKAFAIPRKEPLHHKHMLKNYNVTEFTRKPSRLKKSEIQDALETKAVKATYGSEIDPHMADAYSGASTVKKEEKK